MLQTKQTESEITIVGIDPGTETLGFSQLTFDLTDYSISRIQATTFHASRLSPDSWMEHRHPARFAKINAHVWNLTNLFFQIQPVSIISESPYFSAKFPQAHAALVEILNGIRRSVWEYQRHMVLDLVDPSRVKKAVGAPGHAKKDGVREAIITHPEIQPFYTGAVPIERLDEHSLDSIAVAFFKFNQYRGLM